MSSANDEQPRDVEADVKGPEPTDTDKSGNISNDQGEVVVKKEGPMISTNAKVLTFLALGTVVTMLILIILAATGQFDSE
ncbi:expressed unknown protein [Seminavis robusta]|uniref:Uncharacterized protein n=1 Tax=Seminavis robusta TaxID=568900 RepID=A0A9N8E5U0_9STRA|nr:expressed unknown protein [Seminavis robusta]|eukprot:Sro580_g170100.1 n/a (80) ;mRNA; f:13672-13911